MSNAESIAEVLYQHPTWSEGFYAGWPGWDVWCSGCDAPLTDADALAAHQADMVAAALEPVIREARASAWDECDSLWRFAYPLDHSTSNPYREES